MSLAKPLRTKSLLDGTATLTKMSCHRSLCVRDPPVSDLLLQLPKHGVGSLVTRDTWHPAGGKYWEVVEVVPQRVRHPSLRRMVELYLARFVLRAKLNLFLSIKSRPWRRLFLTMQKTVTSSFAWVPALLAQCLPKFKKWEVLHSEMHLTVVCSNINRSNLCTFFQSIGGHGTGQLIDNALNTRVV